MPLSMRRQTAIRKKQVAQRETEKRKRTHALAMIRRGQSVRSAAKEAGISASTAQRLANAARQSDKVSLEKLLDPITHHAGRKTVLSEAEQELVVSKAFQAARSGMAIDNNMMRNVQSLIANDGRKGFKKGMPSDDALRSFRARNRALTMRKSENVLPVKLAAQNYKHVLTFKSILQRVDREHPGLLKDPERIWNWDETSVLPEFGKLTKCYAPSSSNRGGARVTVKDHGKHVTAGLAASASGRIAPPFLIAAGKKKMSSWLRPLSPIDFTDERGRMHWLCGEDWCPNDVRLLTTPNGSIDQSTIVHMIEHINAFARRFVPLEKHILLILDGHSSRDCIPWLELAERYNIVVAKLPANTTHFLQPCDRSINKTFANAVRETRDELLSMRQIGHANVAFKIRLAVAGHKALSPATARKSFEDTGLWPMDFRFLKPFLHRKHSSLASNAMESGHTPQRDVFMLERLKHYPRQRTDRHLMQRIHEICDGRRRPSVALAEIQVLMQSNFVINKILGGFGNVPLRQGANTAPNIAISAGNEAELMTVGALKEKLEEKLLARTKRGNRRASKNQSQKSTSISNAGKENKPIAAPEPLIWLRLRVRGGDGRDDDDDVPIALWNRNRIPNGHGVVDEDARRRTEAADGMLRLALPR